MSGKKNSPNKSATTSATLTRRSLLRGSALFGGGVLLSQGVTGAPAVPRGAPRKWDLEVDVVSIGSSSGGLLGAIVAQDHGLRAAVLEAAELIGGGTARSNGGMWIPLTRLQRDLGFTDSKEAAMNYIRSTSLGRHDETKLAAFLEDGPLVVDYVNERTPLQIVGSVSGDYYDHLPDSRAGRVVWPNLATSAKLFEQRDRYPLLERVRIPAVPMSVGGQPGVTSDFGGGNALIGGLVAGCADRNIPILLNTRARTLIRDGGRIVGVQAERDGRSFYVRARRGVIIASGGYEWNEELNRRFVPYPDRIYPVTAPENRGDGHLMAMEQGAALALMDCAVWMAALPTPGEKDWGIATGGIQGATISAYPGVIYVNRHGRRVCDEGFYPAVSRAIFAQSATKESAYENLPLFWIMDQAARDKYGFGPLPPGNNEMRPWFHRADNIRDLARQIGVNPDALEETVNRFNAFAREGRDPDFGRGRIRPNDIVREERARARERGGGEEESRSYLSGQLAPLEKPPFYAARLGLGSVGHRGGVVTDRHCRVIDVRGEPIPGLYATSNSAAQLAVGAGYSSGQSIALSLVGGFVAARHIALEGAVDGATAHRSAR